MTRSKTVGVATRPQQIVIFWYIGSNLSSKSIKAVTHPIHTKRQETEPMQNKRPENKNVNKSYALSFLVEIQSILQYSDLCRVI